MIAYSLLTADVTSICPFIVLRRAGDVAVAHIKIRGSKSCRCCAFQTLFCCHDLWYSLLDTERTFYILYELPNNCLQSFHWTLILTLPLHVCRAWWRWCFCLYPNYERFYLAQRLSVSRPSWGVEIISCESRALLILHLLDFLRLLFIDSI